MAYVVEYLSSKREVLGSNSSTVLKKRKKERITHVPTACSALLGSCGQQLPVAYMKRLLLVFLEIILKS
jgi:hypothetical protein